MYGLAVHPTGRIRTVPELSVAAYLVGALSRVASRDAAHRNELAGC